MKTCKKILCILMALLMCLSITACAKTGEEKPASSAAPTPSSSKAEEKPVDSDATIELAYALATDDLQIFRDLMATASEELGFGIEITENGPDHEAIMKTRMASNDMPDIWTTHGWSIIRYGEYTMNLADQPWVEHIDEGMKAVATTEDGELYILPITMAVCGGLYNIDVLEDAGVDVTKILTWDDFNNACATILDKTGVRPFYVAATTGFSLGSYMLECLFPSYLIAEGIPTDYKDALRDGSFDWSSDIAKEPFEMIAGWYEAGYINEDCLTCTKDDAARALANGDAAFLFHSTDIIPSALSYNPDAKIGIMPVPGANGGAVSFGTGEGNYSCFAIWKDTEYETEAKALLNWLAEPENSVVIMTIDGSIPAMTNVEVDPEAKFAYTHNALLEAQKGFDNIYYDNFFDRKYLPSGMWSVMKDAVANLLADGNPSSVVDVAAETMKTNYDELS